MTDVRTYRAATMQHALELVRQEMGAEAVILHTRHVSRRRLLPWKKSKSHVEITAGVGLNVRSKSGGARESVPHSAANNATAEVPLHSAANSVPATKQAGRSEGSTGARHARGRMALSPRPNNTPAVEEQGANSGVASTSHRLAAGSRQNSHHSSQRQSRRTATPADFGVSLRQLPGTATSPAASGPAVSQPRHGGNTAIEFSRRLDTIQRMLEGLGQSGRGAGVEEIPGELFHLYTDLIDAEVEDELARELVFRLKNNVKPGQLDDSTAAKSLLTGMIESEIRCCDPIAPTPGRCKVVALVGSTGVGKTTTIAKLAANFRLRDSVKMGLVTVDTYRIAAVEQLRTYAEIIDLPMKVVTNPLEMRRALDELTGLDLVLIDTAGRSPRDELQIQELQSLLAEAQVQEVQLVLSMTSSLRSLEASVSKFSAAGITSLIMTKLDEAAGMGPLLSLSRKFGLPISYITTGQDVPDDIEAATAHRLARLVLGQERVMS